MGLVMIQYLFLMDIKLLMVKCNIQKIKIDHRYKAFKKLENFFKVFTFSRIKI